MKAFPEDTDQITVQETHIIKRLKFNNLFSAFLQSLNLERGWIFSLKRLFINPGKMALDYAGAGRMRYVTPFKMLFITTTLAIIALKYSGSIELFAQGVEEGSENDPAVINIIEEAVQYFNVIIWLYIPIAAFFTWLANRKSQLNYAENLVLQAYFFVLTNIATLFLVFDKISPHFIWNMLLFAFFMFYNVYIYKGFFSKKWFRSIIESTLLMAVSSVFYFLFLIVAIVVYLYLFKS